jgi:hypothetical protein
MSIPNDAAIVWGIDRAFPHLLERNDLASVREFTWRAARALHEHDPKWGMLSKSAGENGQDIPVVGRVAVDALAYLGEVPSVDIVLDAGSGEPTRPAWGIDEHRRPSNLWIAPPPFADASAPVTPPVTPPVVPPVTPPAADPLAARVEVLARAVDLLEDAREDDRRAIEGLRKALEALAGKAAKAGDEIAVEGAIKVPFYGSVRVLSRGKLGETL